MIDGSVLGAFVAAGLAAGVVVGLLIAEALDAAMLRRLGRKIIDAASAPPIEPLDPDDFRDHPAGSYLTDPDGRDADDPEVDMCRYCGRPAEFDPLDLVSPVCAECREHNLRYREDARHEAMLERAGL